MCGFFISTNENEVAVVYGIVGKEPVAVSG